MIGLPLQHQVSRTQPIVDRHYRGRALPARMALAGSRPNPPEPRHSVPRDAAVTRVIRL